MREFKLPCHPTGGNSKTMKKETLKCFHDLSNEHNPLSWPDHGSHPERSPSRPVLDGLAPSGVLHSSPDHSPVYQILGLARSVGVTTNSIRSIREDPDRVVILLPQSRARHGFGRVRGQHRHLRASRPSRSISRLRRGHTRRYDRYHRHRLASSPLGSRWMEGIDDRGRSPLSQGGRVARTRR